MKGNSKILPAIGTRKISSSGFFHPLIHSLSTLNMTHPLTSGLSGPSCAGRRLFLPRNSCSSAESFKNARMYSSFAAFFSGCLASSRAV